MTKATSEQLRVGIIGAGPVGSTLAVHLAEAGAFVVLCDQDSALVDRIRQSGIRLSQAIEKQAVVNGACRAVKELQPYDLELAIIAVKTPVLSQVVEQLGRIDSGGLFVMCAQNGIDNEQQVSQVFGEERTLRMVINYAGSWGDEHEVEVSFFKPPNYVAALRPAGEALAGRVADLLSSVGLETAVTGRIQDYVWEKAILNATLSGVCAITGRTMQEAIDFPPTMELVEAIIDESMQVAQAEGIKLSPDFRPSGLRYLKQAGRHKPSMLVDLESGRRTEIASLNGKIVDYGRRHNLPTPVNLAVSALVQLMQLDRE